MSTNTSSTYAAKPSPTWRLPSGHSARPPPPHIDALRAVDVEFASGRDGRDVAAHLDDAIRSARAGYAVVSMIIA